MKFKNIVISGDIGTGTSTLTRNLAQALGWQYFSIGDFFRKYALEHNIPLWDKGAVPIEEEKRADFSFLEKIKTTEKAVFEGHYAGWFARDLPETFRILLKADLEISLDRAVKRLDHTHIETHEEVVKRRQGIIDKFKQVYGGDNYLNEKYFHLVVETTLISPQEVLQVTLKRFQEAVSD